MYWNSEDPRLILYLCVWAHRDGIPPYRYRKQHRKEMHESAKANGRVPLPHIPVSIRINRSAYTLHSQLRM